MNNSEIKRASSSQKNIKDALEEISKANCIEPDDFTLFFFSPSYNASDVEKWAHAILGKNCLGCSTAGEIGTNGYIDDGISAISFKSDQTVFDYFLIQDPANTGSQLVENCKTLNKILSERRDKLSNTAHSFAITLIDGLSNSEEFVIGQVGNFLEGITAVGGSAGDKLNFNKTFIYCDEKIHTDCALIIGVTTTIPFKIFKTQHFETSESKMVITSSDPATRTVYEIDGMPAAEAYASLLNMQAKDLNPQVFSKHPVLIKVGNETYVRSIQKMNEDQSLSFYCAIDDGLVLTLASHCDLLTSTTEAIKQVNHELGEISAVFCFECILRKIEVESLPKDKQKEIQSFYKNKNFVGFHTYGEQLGTIHINQTLTGVAFGR